MRKAILLVVALVTAMLIPAPARAAVPKPHTPSGLPSSIEKLARYVGQTSCDTTVKPGTAKLLHLLVATYPGTYVGMNYRCGSNGSVSEHYEGRSLDWMVSIRNPVQYSYAKAVIGWLLATDRAGHKFAMARRLGVQYLIYNNRMWGSWSGTWEPYNNCAKQPQPANDSTCHRNHLHISLSWNGAMGATSFWTKHVYPFDYGPCRTKDLNWAASRTRVNFYACPRYATVRPAAKASATKKALVSYSGAYLRLNRGGPIVQTVQSALHVSVTGLYLAPTRTAVAAFQRRHHLTASGAMNLSTWRALLAVVR